MTTFTWEYMLKQLQEQEDRDAYDDFLLDVCLKVQAGEITGDEASRQIEQWVRDHPLPA